MVCIVRRAASGVRSLKGELVKGHLLGPAFQGGQRRQGLAGGRGKEGGLSELASDFAQQVMRFPAERLLRAPREPHGAAAHQQQYVFQTQSGAIDESAERQKGPAGRACVFDALSRSGVEAFDQVEAEEDALAFGVKAGEMPPLIDARRFDIGPEKTRLVDVKLGRIEAPKIVDAGRHVRQRPIAFEVQTLVALDGKRGGVPL
jgi:hypothetical protein